MNVDRLPELLLKRKAEVYVRQSTQTQVQTNLESRRRQYDLVDEAKRRGFRDIELIDDDMGRSASGAVARPGFERIVALLCAGEVGAVLCMDASRLARNGRDWHHLLELCGLVEARVIDLHRQFLSRRIEPLLAAAFMAACAGRRQAGAGALADQVALELGQGAEQVKHQPTADRRGVNVFLQAM
ncbi:resolvase-like protein [Paraburkholderia sp. BL6665CI2N2]|nr:resolvase-like protein [Paraburkholderia sp. BL6665CI2N2]